MPTDEDPKEEARKERNLPGVERLLRQFITDGPKGNSPEYKKNWARNFGRRTGEHSGIVRCDEDECDCIRDECDDEYCWCKRESDE